MCAHVLQSDLFAKARLVDEVGKREDLDGDEPKLTECWAVQNMHTQLKKIIDEAVSKFVPVLAELNRPAWADSQKLEMFNMDWIGHIGLHTASCVLGWQVVTNLRWGMHTSYAVQ